MGLFDKVSGFVKGEAKDISEAAASARDRLDQELTEREAELEMSPTEKLRALQRQARANDGRIDQIMEKAGAAQVEAEAEAEVAQAATAPLDPPSVTQIVLADGSVRSGADVAGSTDAVEEGAEQAPEAGDLSWIAPREGEEAVVPAFQGRVSVAESSTGESDESAPSQDVSDAAATDDAAAEEHAGAAGATELAEDRGLAEDTGLAAPETTEAALPAPPAPQAVETFQDAAAPPAEQTPPEPPPLPTPEPPPEPDPAPAQGGATGDVPRRETPAEVAARVVAELEQAVAEDPEPEPAPPEPMFEKTPAQRKYEEARKAADALLEELRGELKDEGEI